MNDSVSRARALLAGASRIVALTGAGISTESGIADFRGPQGVWTKDPAAEKLATLSHYMGSSEVRKAAWQKRLETPVLAVTDGLDPKSKAVPIWFSVPLQDLAPGQYDVQVTVAKPGSERVTFWRAPIVVTP